MIQSELYGDIQKQAVKVYGNKNANKHPLVTLLTNVGKVYDGKAWKGSGLLKQATGNPEFGQTN